MAFKVLHKVQPRQDLVLEHHHEGLRDQRHLNSTRQLLTRGLLKSPALPLHLGSIANSVLLHSSMLLQMSATHLLI